MVTSDRIFEYQIEEKHNLKTVKDVLKREFDFSARLITKLKKDDGLRLNGSFVRTIDFVKTGDLLKITLKASKSETLKPVKLDFEIIYEDQDILIVNKPPNMPVHPSVGNIYNTLANAVMYHYYENGEVHLFHPVNRLDINTSGLMAIAKNKYAHAKMSCDMKNNRLKRTYIAIVDGIIKEDFGTIDFPIERVSSDSFKRCVREDGKKAVTHFKVIKRTEKNTFVEIELETGRTHQIRVHFSHLGYPLSGDALYGGSEIFKRPALHSYKINFFHPVTNGKMDFEIKIPAEMLKII